jgi:uncharacterized membrane protein YhiD involved in acid resistance
VIDARRTNDWMDLLQLPDFTWWQFLFAAACLVVLIWSIVRFVSRVHEDVDPAESDQEMLKAISELRRQGDLTEEEYRSIKGQILARMSTGFQDTLSEKQRPSDAGQTALQSLTKLSQKPITSEVVANISESDKSESIQSTTASSLTEVPDPLHDSGNYSPG